MRYSFEFKKKCVELYRQGKWPETPYGVQQHTFRNQIKVWYRIENAFGAEALHHKKQNCEEREVICAELEEISFAAVRHMLSVFVKCNEACKGRNNRAHTADIYADQKPCIVFRELGQQYRCRYVTYYLAGQGGNQHCVLLKNRGKQMLHPVNASHVSRKNKEENKGGHESVIDLFHGVSVSEKQHGRYDRKANPV